MDLFVVNRYEGDESERPESPQDHLSELLKKIELRKQQKSAIPPETPEEEPPRKKKKRKKSTPLIPTDETSPPPSASGAPEVPSPAPPKVQNKKEPAGANNFTILGVPSKQKPKAVARVLPEWLAHPEIISADLSTGPDVDELRGKLDDRLIDILKSNGVKRLFPVQANLINWMLKCSEDRVMGFWPRDTCVSAPTGSGKTLAYVLPIIHQLRNRFVQRIRCLVVLPVQELAAQIFKVFQTYVSTTDLKVGLISGASSFEAEQENLVERTMRGELVSRVDIVVATSGRLVDHILKTEGFSLEVLEFLVIDEADRTTEWLRHIPMPHRCPPTLTLRNWRACKIPPAQKLLFSATLSQDPEKLSRLGLFHPILFTSVVITDKDDDVDLDKETGEFVGRYTSPNELIERAVECAPEYKPVALVKLITSRQPIEKTLVFTNSGEASHRLAVLLRFMLADKNAVVDELSAKLQSKQRTEMLEKFSEGKSQILVSSDALARGMDIAGVKLVVSYDLPKHIKGYIHRAGRTGRAGLPGTAISILTSNQVSVFSRMLTAAHKALPPIDQFESLESVAEAMNYQAHVEKLKEFIENERTKEIKRIKARRKRGRKN
ncbi:probable ATP-dependent RNA helicase Dbp73D [Diachasma alloeum]|uniref:probable ATP-dependent RNA helicase Dbp73D n=1 Tax=Diachasma alloeum TaxID=454923 RepID=UPI0007384EBE|nr:probable ATP-dependent RNA helicase Dbp73D [Diachasma alloeum]